nr:hypothetical protein [Tanacetum cinerariifolium]
MVISNNESSVESIDDGNNSKAKDDIEIGIRQEVDGDRKMEDDDESRFSGRSRVYETPEEERIKKEEKPVADVDKTPREDACGYKKNKTMENKSIGNLGSIGGDISFDKLNINSIESQYDDVENNDKSGHQ